MGEIAINPHTYKLYMVEYGDNGEITAREITKEDISKLSDSQQALVESLQQQAELVQWAKLGWGYKPKLNPAARKPHRAKTYWHRTRSFCVRRGYH